MLHIYIHTILASLPFVLNVPALQCELPRELPSQHISKSCNCKKCCYGKNGDRGKRGNEGLSGTNGTAGQPGLPGTAGPAGDNGATGDPGPTGSDPGPTGNPGPTGDPGATGIPGPTGPTGFTGAGGENGQTGPTGLDSFTPAFASVFLNDPAVTQATTFITYNNHSVAPQGILENLAAGSLQVQAAGKYAIVSNVFASTSGFTGTASIRLAVQVNGVTAATFPVATTSTILDIEPSYTLTNHVEVILDLNANDIVQIANETIATTLLPLNYLTNGGTTNIKATLIMYRVS